MLAWSCLVLSCLALSCLVLLLSGLVFIFCLGLTLVLVRCCLLCVGCFFVLSCVVYELNIELFLERFFFFWRFF